MNTVTDDPLIRQSALAKRLNVQLKVFASWREDGELQSGVHFIKLGRGYAITQLGQTRVLELLGDIPPVKVSPAVVAMRAVCAGVLPRILRCRRVDTGENASVRLTAPNVFASKFLRGAIINATQTETEGVFEYDGLPPRRMRL